MPPMEKHSKTAGILNAGMRNGQHFKYLLHKLFILELEITLLTGQTDDN